MTWCRPYTTIEKDRHVTVEEIFGTFDLPNGTACAALYGDLGLVRSVPKQLIETHEEEKVSHTRAFLNAKFRLKAFLKSIGTMNETNVSFHTPETKEASKQWLNKHGQLQQPHRWNHLINQAIIKLPRLQLLDIK